MLKRVLPFVSEQSQTLKSCSPDLIPLVLLSEACLHVSRNKVRLSKSEIPY